MENLPNGFLFQIIDKNKVEPPSVLGKTKNNISMLLCMELTFD